MRIMGALIISLCSLVSSAQARPTCLNYENWSYVIAQDETADVHIWYHLSQSGNSASAVYAHYHYYDGRGEEGGCVRLRAGGYSPQIYQWLISGNNTSYVKARDLIEVWGVDQHVFKKAPRLGD